MRSSPQMPMIKPPLLPVPTFSVSPKSLHQGDCSSSILPQLPVQSRFPKLNDQYRLRCLSCLLLYILGTSSRITRHHPRHHRRRSFPAQRPLAGRVYQRYGESTQIDPPFPSSRYRMLKPDPIHCPRSPQLLPQANRSAPALARPLIFPLRPPRPTRHRALHACYLQDPHRRTSCSSLRLLRASRARSPRARRGRLFHHLLPQHAQSWISPRPPRSPSPSSASPPSFPTSFISARSSPLPSTSRPCCNSESSEL